MIATALVQRLTPLTSNLYPVVAPIGYSMPAVIYSIANTVPANDLDGVDFAMITLKIDVYDPSYLAAKALAKSIRLNLSAWKDADVMGVVWVDETDMIDQTTELTLYRTMLTFHALAVI